MRGETCRLQLCQLPEVYFNPLPSCEGRPTRYIKRHDAKKISIHSPHARGDSDQTAQ